MSPGTGSHCRCDINPIMILGQQLQEVQVQRKVGMLKKKLFQNQNVEKLFQNFGKPEKFQAPEFSSP
jgi:hypothetical protein